MAYPALASASVLSKLSNCLFALHILVLQLLIATTWLSCACPVVFTPVAIVSLSTTTYTSFLCIGRMTLRAVFFYSSLILLIVCTTRISDDVIAARFWY
jgi:hypothetical protein